jgi:hypothetical protein
MHRFRHVVLAPVLALILTAAPSPAAATGATEQSCMAGFLEIGEARKERLANAPATRLSMLRQQNLALAPVSVHPAPPSLACLGLIFHWKAVASPHTPAPKNPGRNPGNDKAVGNAPFDGVRGKVPSGRS